MSSSSLLRRWVVVLLLGALAGGAGSVLGGQTGLPEIVVNGHDFRVPAGGGRMVYRFAEAGPPEVLEFLETHGRNWRVYWDEALGTPRFLRPLEPVLVVEPEALGPVADDDRIASGVEAFIDAHAEFLGVGLAELAPAHIYRSGTTTILILAQTTPGGIPVRGANVRVVLRTNGELSWMKSFIVRDCPDPEGEFQDLQGLVASTSADGSTVVTSKFQIGFTESDPPVAIPIWSLAVLDPQGEQQSEHIRDARTGELLVRRQVVKYFTPPGTIPVRGTVYGMSPPWWDAYASPQNTESYVQNPIDGSVVRNQQGGGVIATANPAGFFTARIPQENATLSFSLEHGICSPGPDGGAGTYDRTLWVVLSDGGRRPIELGPEEDANGDGVLDITISQPAEVNFRPVFNTVANGQSVARAWALQAHRHAREMFDFVQDTDAKFSLGDSFRGIEPLELRPMSSGTVQDYWHAGAGGELPARVYTSVQYLRRRGPRTDVESFTYDAVPTVFSHELGHHMVYSLTGTRENDNRQAEEGVADVLTAFTNNDARIGFHADGPAGVTEFSFSLGMDDEVRTPLRADVGDAFWLLRGYLPVERITPDTAEGLLLHWLHAHWAPEGDPMRFDAWNGTIFDELLAIAANPPFCQTAGCATAGYDKAIVKAFRGRGSLFDAPFIRGDANVDQQVDISDAIKILDILFVGFGQYVDCWNAVDVDNDGQANITDAIYLLLKLFQGGASIPPPVGNCGLDPERPGDPGNLGCADFTCKL